MGLEAGTFIDDFVIANPIGASDNIDKGDDHIRLIKTLIKNSFPDVDQAVSTIIFNTAEPPLTRKGTLWGDETLDLLKIRDKGDSAFITLAISMLTDNSVDVNAGTIDGATIGAATPSSGKFTTLEASGAAVLNGTINLAGIVTAPNLIPVGTVMCFFQAAAPTGWTQVTTQNDKLLRVVSGVGGGSAGNWTITGVTVDGHAVSIAEMPAHTHTGTKMLSTTVQLQGAAVPAIDAVNVDGSTDSTGGGGTHTHGLTADGAWRPAYIDMIIASKN